MLVAGVVFMFMLKVLLYISVCRYYVLQYFTIYHYIIAFIFFPFHSLPFQNRILNGCVLTSAAMKPLWRVVSTTVTRKKRGDVVAYRVTQ